MKATHAIREDIAVTLLKALREIDARFAADDNSEEIEMIVRAVIENHFDREPEHSQSSKKCLEVVSGKVELSESDEEAQVEVYLLVYFPRRYSANPFDVYQGGRFLFRCGE